MRYKLNKPHPRASNGNGHITKNGHTMLQFDIVQDLERGVKLEAENTALKSELEALRSCEDCTAQEIEIKELRELKRFVSKQVSQSIDGIISEHQALTTIGYRLKDDSDLLPDARKKVTANKGRL